MNAIDPRAVIAVTTLLAAGSAPGHTHLGSSHRPRHAHPKWAAQHRHGHHRHHAVGAHAARDPAVSIVDFAFSPGTTTVHVGDTVTWTNIGKQPHTATANGHSFDTGLLSSGHSASHTFATAGTFTYFCQVHPFMHGTIVVLAATTTTSTHPPAPASTRHSGSAPGKPAVATAPSGPTLPFTGLDLPAAVTIGLLLMGTGLAVRLVLRVGERREG